MLKWAGRASSLGPAQPMARAVPDIPTQYTLSIYFTLFNLTWPFCHHHLDLEFSMRPSHESARLGPTLKNHTKRSGFSSKARDIGLNSFMNDYTADPSKSYKNFWNANWYSQVGVSTSSSRESLLAAAENQYKLLENKWVFFFFSDLLPRSWESL